MNVILAGVGIYIGLVVIAALNCLLVKYWKNFYYDEYG